MRHCAGSPEHPSSTRLASPSRSALVEVGIVVAGSIALAVLYMHPIVDRWQNAGVADSDFDQMWHGAARRSVLQYWQIPLWNPYETGGRPLLANPETRILTPFFGLHLAFGTVVGIKLSLILHLVLGLVGMYYLARHFAMDRLAAWIPGLVFALNSKYALHATEGLGHYMSTVYLPWALLFYLKSFRRPIWILLAAACQTLIFLDGGHYYVIISLTFLACLSCLLIVKHGFLQPILRVVAISILTICLGAIKFFPAIVCVLELSSLNKDRFYDGRIDEGLTTGRLVHGLFDRDQRLYSHLPSPQLESLAQKINSYSDQQIRVGSRDFMRYLGLPEWTDNGMYIGWGSWFLFLLGVTVWGKRYWYHVVAILLFFWLAFGSGCSPSIWKLISRLPPFDNMLETVRFDIISLLLIAVFAGLGFQFVRHVVYSGYIARVLATCVLPAVIVTFLWEWTSPHTDLVAASGTDLMLVLVSVVSVVIARYALPNAQSKSALIPMRSKWIGDVVSFGMLALIAYDLLAVNSVILRDPQAYPLVLPAIKQDAKFVQTTATSGWSADADRWEHYGLYRKFLSNRGALDAPVSFEYRQAVVPIGSPHYAGEQWLLPLASGDAVSGNETHEIVLRQWSLNKLTFSVQSRFPAAVVVNQCYDSGWKAKRNDSRTAVIDVEGLVGVALPEGKHEVEVYYLPNSFLLGAVVSLLSLFITVAIALYFWRRPLQQDSVFDQSP